jgi:hypothetical protein
MATAKKSSKNRYRRPKKKAALQARAGGAEPKLRIRVRAYEHKILDLSVKQIMDTALRYRCEDRRARTASDRDKAYGP